MTDSGERGGQAPMFTLAVHNNKHRSLADRELYAVVAVTAHDLAGAAAGGGHGGADPAAAEVIVVDRSGSMDAPPEKMVAARRAAIAAIEAIRDGVEFAIVAGAHDARMLYPEREELAVASPATRREATRAIGRLYASGGTAIGGWLTLARRLLEPRQDAIRHVLLFTDGRNEGESAEELDAALAACAPCLRCDARGIGADWAPAEVLRVVTALGGQADAVRAYADLEDDFRDLMRAAMRKRLASVSLRVRTMTGSTLRLVEQAYPSLAELSGTPVGADGRVVEFPIGAWADGEYREYHLCLSVDPEGRPVEVDTVAARVELVAPGLPGGPVVASAPVPLRWTADDGLSERLDPYTQPVLDQQELTRATLAGCDALSRGDEAAAAHHLGVAARLAHRLGNTVALRRIGRVAHIDDAAAGLVRPRADAVKEDIYRAEMGSVITVPALVADLDGAAPAAAPTPTAFRPCARCDYPCEPDEGWCQRCGARL